MDLTINCTRVPIPVGTLFEGVPVEIGPAPALPGLDSDHTSPREDNDGAALNPLGRVVSDGKDKRPKQLFNCRKYRVYQKNKATTKFKIERKVLNISSSTLTSLFLTKFCSFYLQKIL